MTATLVTAILSVCLASAPSQCERHQFRIERSACGLHKRAEVPSNGQWVAAVASITCR